MSSKVSIPDTFNGPMGLLYSLIIRDEIDIFDIPIARVTAAYCEEIAKMEHVNIDEEGEFLLLASRLKDIKLRMLFPPEERIDEDEEDEDYDPRPSLVEALLEYRRFKDAARMLGDMAEEQSRRYPRVAPRMEFRLAGDMAPESDSHGLLRALQNMINRLAREESGEERQERKQTEIPIARRIEQVESVLSAKGEARFSHLLSDKPDRGEMVGFFMALLELMRRGVIHARQTEDFSDIVIEPRQAEADKPVAFRIARRRAAVSFPAAVPCRKRAVRANRPPPSFPVCVSGGNTSKRKSVRVRAVAAFPRPASRKRKQHYGK